MDAKEIYQEIKIKYPNLVEDMLNRSRTESESERQTIYGDLMDWMRDNYTSIHNPNRDEVVTMLLGDYVIRHPYCLQKVYNVVQESNVDGEILINVVPCSTLEAAKKVVNDEIDVILTESYHFGECDDIETAEENYDVEKTDTSFYINDPCDDYYEDIKIEEQIIL